MANQKISELSALTTPADDDLLVVVDDSESASEKTKKLTFANLKLAVTGVGATYGVTGAYTATMPTEGVAASSKIMLGNSSTIAWFYLNTAPPGWKALTTGADTVLGIAGGTGYFNVSGGSPDDLNSWEISGLTTNTHTHTGPSHTHTGPSHTHTGPSHTHTATTSDMTQIGSGYTVTADAGDQVGINHTHTLTTAAGGTGNTGAGGTGATGAGGTGTTSTASTRAITSSGVWRPAASVGKLFQLDTA